MENDITIHGYPQPTGGEAMSMQSDRVEWALNHLEGFSREATGCLRAKINDLTSQLTEKDKAMREMAECINCDSGCPLVAKCKFISRRQCNKDIIAHYLGEKGGT